VQYPVVQYFNNCVLKLPTRLEDNYLIPYYRLYYRVTVVRVAENSREMLCSYAFENFEETRDIWNSESWIYDNESFLSYFCRMLVSDVKNVYAKKWQVQTVKYYVF